MQIFVNRHMASAWQAHHATQAACRQHALASQHLPQTAAASLAVRGLTTALLDLCMLAEALRCCLALTQNLHAALYAPVLLVLQLHAAQHQQLPCRTTW
jgi:hypothetical protein